jgi:hypothetical protein
MSGCPQMSVYMCRQRRADIPVRLSLQEAGWKTRSPLRGGSGLESPLSFEKLHFCIGRGWIRGVVVV